MHLPDADEHRRRVEARRPDLDAQVVPTWTQVETWTYEPWEDERDGERLAVDGTSTGQALAAILAYVGPAPGRPVAG